MCIYYATELIFNLSPSTLEFCLIIYFILYVCHLMVNENNFYCFKWTSIHLFLDSKFYFLFSLPTDTHFNNNIIANFTEVKCHQILCNLCGFVTSVRSTVKKWSKLNRSDSVLCCSGTSCGLRDSSLRNPSSISQCQIAPGIH